MQKLLVLSILGVAACGGGGSGGGNNSGIADTRTVDSLSAMELDDLCEELAAEFPTREVTCDGLTLTVGIDCAEDELFSETCTITVGEARDCIQALDNLSDSQICTSETPPAPCAGLAEQDC